MYDNVKGFRGVFVEIEKNKIYISEAVDYTSEGNGVFKINGMTVFVPNAAAGDKAEIKIVKVGKNYSFGNAAAAFLGISDILPNLNLRKKEYMMHLRELGVLTEV